MSKVLSKNKNNNQERAAKDTSQALVLVKQEPYSVDFCNGFANGKDINVKKIFKSIKYEDMSKHKGMIPILNCLENPNRSLIYGIDERKEIKQREALCEICGMSFKKGKDLWKHVCRQHSCIQSFDCQKPGCLRKFTIRPDLDDHMRKCHKIDLPHVCFICNERFLTQSVYDRHCKNHESERRKKSGKEKRKDRRHR